MASTLVERDLETNELPLGVAIRLLRERVKLSARALSLNAGLSESYCGKVEKGAIEPSFRAFAAIIYQLGLTPRETHLLVIREALREVPAGVTSPPYGMQP